jgi:hypothetical protein
LQDQTVTLNNGTIPEAELPSEFMTEVYLFRGTKEFTQLPSMKQKNFESTVKNFGDSMLEYTFSKYPVQFLSKWYDKINEFGTVLKHCNYLDNCSHIIWDYRLIVLNPQANPSSVSSQQKAKKMNWAQDLAIDFLNSVFNSNIDDRESIGSAVFMEFTLMIVACRRAQKRILPKRCIPYTMLKKMPWYCLQLAFVTELKQRLVWGFFRGWQLRRPTHICLVELTVGDAWELVVS